MSILYSIFTIVFYEIRWTKLDANCICFEDFLNQHNFATNNALFFYCSYNIICYSKFYPWPVPARPTVCLPSSSRRHSPSPRWRCRRELSEEGEKANGGGGAGGGAGRAARCGGGGTAVSLVGRLSPAVMAASWVRGEGCWGERWRLEIEEVGRRLAVGRWGDGPRSRVAGERQVGMEG
jgi:hypothetical protein